MKRKPRYIGSVPHDVLQHLLDSSCSFVEVFIKLGVNPYSGGSYRTLMSRLSRESFDLTKLSFARSCRPRSHKVKSELSSVLIEYSPFKNSTALKKRIVVEGLLPDLCADCGLSPSWNNKPITLQLDHINGVHNDNRLSNLRILCPNCHTQTATYGSKNVKSPHRPGEEFTVCVCNKPISSGSKTCVKCRWTVGGIARGNMVPTRRQKIEWPSREDLEILLEKSNYTQVGKKLGVSDNAIRKRLKR